MRIFVMMPFGTDFDLVREAIRNASVIAQVTVRLSNEINTTGRIDDLIIDEIRSADACVADLTGHNPNVAWEMGYAQSLGKEIVIITQNIKKLFFDTQNYMTYEYHQNNLDALTQKLVSIFNSPNFRKHRATPSVLAKTSTHPDTSIALAGVRINGAPYDFVNLMKRAESHVFTIAQNHFFFVQYPEILQAAVLQFLQTDSSRRFSILMCDARVRYSVRAWMHVTAPRYGIDLEKAGKFFDSFKQWAAANGIDSQITIRKTPLVPISMTFVDPMATTGILVITPNIYQHQNNIRPFFVLSRQDNAVIFDRYFEAYNSKLTDEYSIDTISTFVNLTKLLLFRRLW